MDSGEPRRRASSGSYPGAKTEPTGHARSPVRPSAPSRSSRRPRPYTRTQVALLDTRDRTLYCGDAYSTLGGVARPAPRCSTRAFPLPGTSPPGTSRRRSSRREACGALEPRALAPGHGKVVADPLEAMDAAIARASLAGSRSSSPSPGAPLGAVAMLARRLSEGHEALGALVPELQARAAQRLA